MMHVHVQTEFQEFAVSSAVYIHLPEQLYQDESRYLLQWMFQFVSSVRARYLNTVLFSVVEREREML